MTEPEKHRPEYWAKITPPGEGAGATPIEHDDGPLPTRSGGTGLSIGAIFLSLFALLSSLLIPPFAALLAVVGITLSTCHLKRAAGRPKVALAGIIVSSIALAVAIGMTIYAYTSGPTTSG